MNFKHSLSAPLVGLALFSMFFGSGNLIFPLYVGEFSQGSAVMGAFGFVLTAVFLPLLGVIAMVVFDGDYKRFFNILTPRGGFLFVGLLLTVWIPLGSSPRCITLAYASLLPYLSMPSFWLFSLVYCAIVGWIVIKPTRMIDILGFVLTPLLLSCLAFVLVYGIWNSHPSTNVPDGGLMWFNGLREGFNTMDLIAAFFFSASIIDILRGDPERKGSPLKLIIKACLIAMSLLGLIYFGLVLLAARNAGLLLGIPKDQLLSYLSYVIMGPQLGIVTAAAITLACLTTSVALIVVYADFLNREVFDSKNYNYFSLQISLVATFGMSLTGLEGITAITGPLLQIFYPILLLLIIVQITRIYSKKKDKSLYTR